MNLLEYLGKFHPLIVHLPIGILSLLVLLTIFIPRSELSQSIKIVKLTLLLSALAASFSSISGFILMNTGSYSGKLITGHQVLGIALTLVNWAVWLGFSYIINSKLSIYRGVLGIMAILMIATGHAGGSLTHGSDFLAPPAPSAWFGESNDGETFIDMNTNAYDAVHLILDEKCIVCHGPNKQKGQLRLDNQVALLEGGKSGDLMGNQSGTSLLIQRITLPLEDEEHMPPTERKQLTYTEIAFLSWWIEAGASFDQTLAELSLPDSLAGLLSSTEVMDPFLPLEEVNAAAPEMIEKLRRLDVVINPVAQDNPYLSANFVNVLNEDLSEAILSLLDINEQLVFLSLDGQSIAEHDWETIGQLSNLRKLSVSGTNLGEARVTHLENLNELVYLNLVGANISQEGLLALSGLDHLKYLYLYQTGLSSKDIADIASKFPQTIIDTGNYQVPILASDTTVLRME